MIALFKKRPKTVIVEELPVVETVPEYISFDPNAPMGNDFNIILMVKEHAPKRLAAIKVEVALLEKQLHALGYEAGQLEALVNALK